MSAGVAAERGPDAPTEQFLAARAVANAFGIALRTLHGWETAGVLRPVRIRGRRYYRACDVEALWRHRFEIERYQSDESIE